MRIKRFTQFIALVVFGLASLNGAFGQATDNGSLNGTVSDQNGALIPGATVTIKNLTTGLTRTTTVRDNGTWNFAVLPLGNYEVKAEAAGFEPKIEQTTVAASVATEVFLILGVAGVEGAVVNVEITDDSGPLPEGTSVTGAQLTGKKLEALPSIRGAFTSLTTDASVAADLNDPLANGSGNQEVSVAGSRTTSQSVLFNGIDATNATGTGSLTGNISPAPETVQEVKILTSGYDASLGRSGGGNIQLVTRGGGNTFNGNAYAYVQNELFNANDFFFNRDGIDRQKARKFEGGATLGGPIKRDRAFFFVGYQRTDSSTAYVPTAQSYTILPEALALINDRTDPEAIRLAFLRTAQNGGQVSTFGNAFTFLPGPGSPGYCVRTLTPGTFAGTIASTCIDPTSPGFRLFGLRNPVTGGFLIPQLTAGRFERLFYNTANVEALLNGTTRITDFTPFGLPNGLPILDRGVQGRVRGGFPLVRVRNVFPAEYEQDQFTGRIDYTVSPGNSEGKGLNTLSGTLFWSDFPSLDPFSDDTLVSATPLIKDDRNRTLAITNTHFFSPTLINEVRFGYFFLDNTRELDERFLANELTNPGLGIFNPATVFDSGPATLRGARWAGFGNFRDFSLMAPNDVYNKRNQTTLTFANNTTWIKGRHSLRFGVEHKRNLYDTNLPEEQGVEFEGLTNFTELLTGFVPEADVAFGITDKQFRFNDLSFYISDEFKFSQKLTLTMGLRWDWFGWPIEKFGRFSNFDFSRVTDPNNIQPGFILPTNIANTGVAAIDQSLGSIASAGNKHTLNGHDLNNFAPRVGFAFKPFKNDSTVIRGGYGIFFDRPSAAFINTIYSNYPFFKEIEVATESSPSTVQTTTAFNQTNPMLPFSSYFPFRVAFRDADRFTPYVLIDQGPGADPIAGVESLEFRAIDRDLKTPMVQQWNVGLQREFTFGKNENWTVEARYIGSKGQQLLLAVGFNQPYDLNDPNTPDYIYGRLNDAFDLARPGVLPARAPGLSERARGTRPNNNVDGAFGACSTVWRGLPGYIVCNNGNGGIDLNASAANFQFVNALIAAEVRVPYLGFDPTDAIILQSRGYSSYHSGLLNVTRRFSKGFGLNLSYTWSKSIDIGSTDPGSTTASGRPDTPNLGLVVQGDQRDLNANKAVSDFDRPHKLAGTFTLDLPFNKSKNKWINGFQLVGSGQWQSGAPFSIIASDAGFEVLRTSGDIESQFFGIFLEATERNAPLIPLNTLVRIFNVGGASGTIFNAAFGRPSVRSLELLRRGGADRLREFFNICQDPNNSECALVAPLGGFGNLGRNTLRGPSQKRIDFSLQKTTRLSERLSLELKWDVFNIFNWANFANPNSDLSDETDFGQITRTVGAPRVMQFGAKLRF